MSNYANWKFTNEEVITRYLFGIIDGRTQITQIDEYTDRHWRDWFPKLPSDEGDVPRLNKMADVFTPLLELIVTELEMDGAPPG